MSEPDDIEQAHTGDDLDRKPFLQLFLRATRRGFLKGWERFCEHIVVYSLLFFAVIFGASYAWGLTTEWINGLFDWGWWGWFGVEETVADKSPTDDAERDEDCRFWKPSNFCGPKMPWSD